MNNYQKACLKIENYRRNNLGNSCCCAFGPTGPTGATGEAGLGSVSIGTTSTGAAGTNATVTNTGTAQDAILNFTIPRGATGAAGPTGATGPQGEAGAAGADAETPTISIGTVTTGDPGTQAAASITGTAPNYILNLTIPQGPTGQNA